MRTLSRGWATVLAAGCAAALGTTVSAIPGDAVFQDQSRAQTTLTAASWGGTMTLNYAIDTGACKSITVGAAGTTSGSILWGDGTKTPLSEVSHTYDEPGNYSVNIVGTFTAFNPVGASAQCLTSVTRWDAETGTTNLAGAFKGASRLTHVEEIPPGATIMTAMFQEATVFNGDISSWDTSKVTAMNRMFYQASAFNQPLNTWDVSNVIDMTSIFDMAFAFNQPLDRWDVRKVTNLTYAFASTYAFNQPLDSWRTSSLVAAIGTFYNARVFNQSLDNWDMSRVGDFSLFFSQAYAFNGNIASWNTGNGTIMTSMFAEASAFNQDLRGWNVRWVASRPNFDYRTTSWNPAYKPVFY